MDNNATKPFAKKVASRNARPQDAKAGHCPRSLIVIFTVLCILIVILATAVVVVSVGRSESATNNDETLVAESISQPDSEYKPEYIQDLTPDTCKKIATDIDYTVKDIRDDKTYTVRYLAGACWMTQNLAIEPTTLMTAADTNISDVYTKENPYSFSEGSYDYAQLRYGSDECSWKNTSDLDPNEEFLYNICYHVADAEDSEARGLSIEQLGAWYNYAAATAGTIVGYENGAEATYDICPKSWHLPTFNIEYVDGHFRENLNDGISEASGEMYDLIENVNDYAQFNPVISDTYRVYIPNKTIPKPKQGIWWSASGYKHTSDISYTSVYGEEIAEQLILEARFALTYNHDENGKFDFGDYQRGLGASIRCVRSK